MQINGVSIEDTFAEAFPMWAARLIVTARSIEWARLAAQAAAGMALSVIGCSCEAGLEAALLPEQTPDGRPGQAVLLFTVKQEAIERELLNRIGQAVLTAPTSACYNGLSSDRRLSIGKKLRFFGDGFQSSKLINGQRFWRVPVMDGEFLIEESFGVIQGVGGGNFMILADSGDSALEAAQAASRAVARVSGAIAPFPGGICRSGSKIGSRYTGVRASTNQAFCPTLRGRVDSKLPEGAHAAYEIVLDGLDEAAVARAMQAGILAACRPGVIAITAGNFGGQLGPYHFHLRQVISGAAHAPEA